jgi:hypothetical protein
VPPHLGREGFLVRWMEAKSGTYGPIFLAWRGSLCGIGLQGLCRDMFAVGVAYSASAKDHQPRLETAVAYNE